jgi:hypothetical protein
MAPNAATTPLAPMAANWNPTLVASPAGTPPGWNANPFATGVMQPTAANPMVSINLSIFLFRKN